MDSRRNSTYLQKFHFQIRYDTQYGQNICIFGSLPQLGSDDPSKAVRMSYIGHATWDLVIDLPVLDKQQITYNYCLIDDRYDVKPLVEPGSVRSKTVSRDLKQKMIECVDFWGVTQLNNNEDSEFRIMTYNIRYANLLDGKYVWNNRKHMVSSMIRLHKADVIGIQEAVHHQVEDLARDLPGYRWIGVGRDDGKYAGEFVPIFYKRTRMELLEEGHFWLSEQPYQSGSKSWGTACPRMCTWAAFLDKHNMRKFYLFNTHLDHVSSKAQLNGVNLILKQIQNITKGNFPVILTGDFNVNPSSEVIAATTSKDPNRTFVLQYAKNISQFPHHGPTGTFTGFDSTNKPELIDYIFVVKFNVIQHGVLSDRWDKEYTPSDHRPIVADLLFSE